MDCGQRRALALRETDVQGAINRLCGDETLYFTCLKAFLDDPTMEELNSAVEHQAWDEAFTAAHALKGLAGNLGFVPLMHSVGKLVVTIRGGRTKDMRECMELVNSSYRDICDAIQQSMMYTEENRKGISNEE